MPLIKLMISHACCITKASDRRYMISLADTRLEKEQAGRYQQADTAGGAGMGPRDSQAGTEPLAC